MSRFRPVVAAACLAAFVSIALPVPGAAQRDAVEISAAATTEPMGERLIGAVLAWGRIALGWLQAIVEAEHGQIAENPVVPPTTP